MLMFLAGAYVGGFIMTMAVAVSGVAGPTAPAVGVITSAVWPMIPVLMIHQKLRHRFDRRSNP